MNDSKGGWKTATTTYRSVPTSISKHLGTYPTRELAEQAIAEMEANRCPCGGIDLHLSSFDGQHWYRELGEWH